MGKSNPTTSILKNDTKSMSKSKKSTSPVESEPSSSTSAQDQHHPILILMNKKVRAARKKMDKIRALEDAIASGKLVNEQQRQVLNNKFTSEKLLTEFESIHAQCQEFLKLEETSTASTTSTGSSGSSSTLVEEPSMEKGKEQEEEALVMECKETMTEEDIPEEIVPVVVPDMDAVTQILEVIHVVTLHQALGNPVPSPLDFFMKTLCGKSRPPAEISFHENLMESLEEAKRYLGASEKVVACEMTYAQLRETIRTLVRPPSPVAVVVASPVKSPQFNFFTESQLVLDEEQDDVEQGRPEADMELSEPHSQAPAASSSSRKSSSRGKQYRPVSKETHSNTGKAHNPAGKPHSKETSANVPNNKQHRRPRSARQTSNNSRSSNGGKPNTMKNSAPSPSPSTSS